MSHYSASFPDPDCYSYAKMLQLSIKIIWNMNREWVISDLPLYSQIPTVQVLD